MHNIGRAVGLATLLAMGTAHAATGTDGYVPAAYLVEHAPSEAWRAIAPDNLLLLEFENGQRIIIELAADFAPVHAANIRALARGKWYDGGRIIRVQDNHLVLWVGAHSDVREQNIQVPGLVLNPLAPLPPGVVRDVPAERERPVAGSAVQFTAWRDGYADKVGYLGGWSVASDGTAIWLAHCYGTVSVPLLGPGDFGSGIEMFAMIGQAAREFDDNFPIIGRLVEGASVLATLPRGDGEAGFYGAKAPAILIKRVRLVADLPPAQQPRFDVMKTDSPTFAAYLKARELAPFGPHGHVAGGGDVCNTAVPVRPHPAA